MSDFADTNTADGPDLTAAEYALGVLGADERRDVERRMIDDAAFAREVQRWDAVLAPFAAGVSAVPPPPGLWARIEGALKDSPEPAKRGAEGVVELGLRRSLRIWRAAAARAAAIAAVLVAALVLTRPGAPPPPRPQPAPAAPAHAPGHGQPMLVARLVAKSGATRFVASLDPSVRELVVTPASVRAIAGRLPEVWLIPTGGKPVALGLASFSRPTRIDAALVAGAAPMTLAVSIEPLGGSLTGQPTGPVVATGKLTPL